MSSNFSGSPQLIYTISSFSTAVNEAIFIPGSDAIVTVANDRSLRIWMKRNSEKFWPTVMEVLPSPGKCLLFALDINRLFCGLENGTVMEFSPSTDLNHIEHKRDYLAHLDLVAGMVYSPSLKWFASTSKDRTVAFYSVDTGKCLQTHQMDSPGTCIVYDSGSHYVFVGENSGRIVLLSMGDSTGAGGIQLVREFCGHDNPVMHLAWDDYKSRLFSCSSDKSIIFWDVGGSKGSAYELLGHSKDVSSVQWWPEGNNSNAPTRNTELHKGFVISGSLDGYLIFWIMDPSREQTPTWSESDVCMLCTAPFFWNVRRMWDIKSTGVRQHHCRRCGKAVCDKCSMMRSIYPVMGYELEVRICNGCSPSITQTDKRSLCHRFNANHPITNMCLERDNKLLLTVGNDNVVKIWDVKSLC